MTLYVVQIGSVKICRLERAVAPSSKSRSPSPGAPCPSTHRLANLNLVSLLHYSLTRSVGILTRIEINTIGIGYRYPLRTCVSRCIGL